MARRDNLTKMKQLLLARRAELRRRLGQEMDSLDSFAGNTTGDSADAAFDSGFEELASTLAEMESDELHQIEHALLKIEQGTYGRCEGCGCKIPVLRLQALPFSVYCISCQRDMERNDEWEPSISAAEFAKLRDLDGDGDEREVDIGELEVDLSK